MATNIIVGNRVLASGASNNTPPKGTSYYINVDGEIHLFSALDTPIGNLCGPGNLASTVSIGGNKVAKNTVKLLVFGEDYGGVSSIPGNFLRSFSNLFEVHMLYMNNLNTIGAGILLSANSLRAIKLVSAPPQLGLNAFLYARKLKYIYVQPGFVDGYKVAPGWVDFLDKIRPIYF